MGLAKRIRLDAVPALPGILTGVGDRSAAGRQVSSEELRRFSGILTSLRTESDTVFNRPPFFCLFMLEKTLL
ncbi:hypothetical protein ABZS88_43890 [Streptomyces sp. NPDC005480]|uniref:hypothetical protein n=1 Tax=Streptomyces sp. NPDC005480 TaxID=3154880 RepID=UPI0033B3B554